MLTMILLSDVGEEDGPTKVVPLSVGESVPYWPNTLDETIDFVADYLPAGAFADEEVAVAGAAGTLFAFRSDVLHRGSRITAERAARFTMLADYDVWGPRWTGRVAWAQDALSPEWRELIEPRLPASDQCSGSRLPVTPTGTSKRWPTHKRAIPAPT